MTSYEMITIVLGMLTFLVTLISLIVKMLLIIIIIDKSKKITTSVSGKVEVVILTSQNPRHNRLSVALFTFSL